LWARRSKNARDEFASGRPHEAFELRRELRGDLLPIEHQSDYADNEQHERRQR
jgi:hypothetical protein